MNSNHDSTQPQFTFDLNKNALFVKDQHNFINLFGVNQLNTLDNISLLDIYLSANKLSSNLSRLKESKF